MSTHSHWFLVGIAAAVGLIIGIIEAILWYFGFIPFVRAMIPFGMALGLVIFALTTMMVVRYVFAGAGSCEREELHIFRGFSDYVQDIMISSTVFLVFCLVVLATFLPLIVRAILAFIGGISFWVMLLVFVAVVLNIAHRR